jgi:4'-phosphopantetheinyl transferase EntD
MDWSMTTIGHALDDQVVESLFLCRVKAVVTALDHGSLKPTKPGGSARHMERGAAAACAQQAVMRLGVIGNYVRGEKGVPSWPYGVTGAISHKRGLCVAVTTEIAVTPSVGVDIECTGPPLPRTARRLVLCSVKDKRVPSRPYDGAQVDWARVVFSVKEAVYKAWYPLREKFLEPDDVSLTFDRAEWMFRAFVRGDSRYEFRGSSVIVGEFIASACHAIDHGTAMSSLTKPCGMTEC